jgi:hypothetical protein
MAPGRGGKTRAEDDRNATLARAIDDSLKRPPYATLAMAVGIGFLAATLNR